MTGRGKPASIQAGPITILPAQRRVLHGDVRCPMSSSQYDALEMLALAGGRPVPSAAIVAWVLRRPHRGFGDQGAAQTIFGLRRRLPLAPDGQSLILTVTGAGFALRVNPTGAAA